MRGRPRRGTRAALAAAAVTEGARRPAVATDAAGLTFRPAPAHLPEGQRLYAIGDVRGCAAALAALHRAIAADLAARPAVATVVHLGNLIGPGPDSAGVLGLLACPRIRSAALVLALRGNLEQYLLDALDGDRAAATDFLHAGGAAALRSWAVPDGAPRAAWAGFLPPDQLAMMRAGKLSWRRGGYLLAHAGVRPAVTLARQTQDDLLSIRQPFLEWAGAFGAVVVHGHSVVPAPEVRANRIAVDTGAGLGGPLTCAVIEQDRVGFLQIAAARDGWASPIG